MDSVVVHAINTESGDDSKNKTKYLTLQPFRSKSGYTVTEHCQNAESKTEGGHADHSAGTHDCGEASQTTEDSKPSDELDQDMSNDISYSSTKKRTNCAGPQTRYEISNEAASMFYRLMAAM